MSFYCTEFTLELHFYSILFKKKSENFISNYILSLTFFCTCSLLRCLLHFLLPRVTCRFAIKLVVRKFAPRFGSCRYYWLKFLFFFCTVLSVLNFFQQSYVQDFPDENGWFVSSLVDNARSTFVYCLTYEEEGKGR